MATVPPRSLSMANLHKSSITMFGVIIQMFGVITVTLPAFAEATEGEVVHTTVELLPEPETSPPAPQASQPGTSTASPTTSANASTVKPTEQSQAEAALGARNLSREYARFEVTQSTEQPGHSTFAEHLSTNYASRLRSGVILATVPPTIFAALTIWGVLKLYAHGKADGGGFCNHRDSYEVTTSSYGDDDYYYDDYYTETVYDEPTCEGDEGEVAGIVLISTFGGVGFLATLIPGIVKIAKYSKRTRRLEPLVATNPSSPVSFSLDVGPQSLNAGFRF